MADTQKSKPALDNRANQLNPHHREYYRSRGDSDDVAERNAEAARSASREADR